MRLDKVKEALGPRVEFQWKSYALLMGRADSRLVTPHGRTSRAAASEAEPEARFEPWAADKPYISSSLPALEAAKCAAAQGPQAFESYHRALFRAIFVESIDVSDYSQLTALAAREGLDAERFKRDLDGGQQKVAVIGEHLEMVMEHGEAPAGLPLVLIEGREPIVGAAPADLYRRILERAIEKRGVG